jgi:hypothetical protein
MRPISAFEMRPTCFKSRVTRETELSRQRAVSDASVSTSEHRPRTGNGYSNAHTLGRFIGRHSPFGHGLSARGWLTGRSPLISRERPVPTSADAYFRPSRRLAKTTRSTSRSGVPSKRTRTDQRSTMLAGCCFGDRAICTGRNDSAAGNSVIA